MKKELSMNGLTKEFKEAIDTRKKYVYIFVRMEGFQECELIVNLIENASEKLEYYKKTYDEGLYHRFSKGIAIVGYGTSNHLEGLYE